MWGNERMVWGGCIWASKHCVESKLLTFI